MTHDQPPADPAAYIHQVAAHLADMGLHGEVRVDGPDTAAALGRQWGEIGFPREWPIGVVFLAWSDVPANPALDLAAGWELWGWRGRITYVRPGGLRHAAPEEVARESYPHIAVRASARMEGSR